MQSFLSANHSRWSRKLLLLLVALTACLLAVGQYGSTEASAAQPADQSAEEGIRALARVRPVFEVDPFWPDALPDQWVMGQVAGIDVDQHDNIWLVQRPGSLTGADLAGNNPAPPVMQFDADGNLLQAWGPGADDPREWPPGGNGATCQWPNNEHGLWVDADDNVWLGGNGAGDHQVLKLSNDGESCLLQIGEAGVTQGSNSEEFLGSPAEGSVDDEANEVYIADGYTNNRVVVFDSETGEYKRHWGAYGQRPNDDVDSPLQFGNPVHCAELSNDDLVYVCDRPNNRVQVFEKDGTFVDEFFVRPATGGNGTTWDVTFSADPPQTFLYDADGENQRVHIFDRRDQERIGEFGRGGRYAGQFHWVHNLVTDSRGNIYTAEVSEGKRAQKFIWRGFEPRDDGARSGSSSRP